MATLASRLLLDGKLPGRLQGEGALQAAIAPHDADLDGAFSYDEYMDAQATVNRAELGAEAGGAPLQGACGCRRRCGPGSRGESWQPSRSSSGSTRAARVVPFCPKLDRLGGEKLGGLGGGQSVEVANQRGDL